MNRACYEAGMGALLKSHGIFRFTPQELCRVGRMYGTAVLQAPPAELWPNIIPTVIVAQEAAEHFGVPFIVNSGYRDYEYNRAVGSTSRRHVEFYSLDIRPVGVSTRELYQWLERHPQAANMGLGLYPTFVHMDTMVRGRW